MNSRIKLHACQKMSRKNAGVRGSFFPCALQSESELVIEKMKDVDYACRPERVLKV